MSTNATRVYAVEQFIKAVVDAAITDAQEGIAEYDPRNSGERLIGRLNLSSYRLSPRNGDSKYARSLYTAARWLYDTEVKNPPPPEPEETRE